MAFPKFSFVILQGFKGPPGTTGEVGPDGPDVSRWISIGPVHTRDHDLSETDNTLTCYS